MGIRVKVNYNGKARNFFDNVKNYYGDLDKLIARNLDWLNNTNAKIEKISFFIVGEKEPFKVFA